MAWNFILFLRLHNGSVDQYTKLYKDSGEGKLSDDNLRLTRWRTFEHIETRTKKHQVKHQWIIIVKHNQKRRCIEVANKKTLPVVIDEDIKRLANNDI